MRKKPRYQRAKTQPAFGVYTALDGFIEKRNKDQAPPPKKPTIIIETTDDAQTELGYPAHKKVG